MKNSIADVRKNFNLKKEILKKSSTAHKRMKMMEEAEASSKEEIQENSIIKNKRFGKKDIFNIHNKAAKKLKLEEAVKIVSTEAYSSNKLEKKLATDLGYLMELGESTLKLEESKEIYKTLVKELLIETANLYKEAGITPRTLSLAIDYDNSIEENFRIYSQYLIKDLEENFRKPLLNGTLLQESEEPVKRIIKIVMSKGLGDDLGEIDPGEMGTFLPFMDTVKKHIGDVVVPPNAAAKVDSFVDSQDVDGDADADDDTDSTDIKEILQNIDDKLEKIAAVLSPAMFKDKVDLGESSFDGTKYAVLKVLTENADKLKKDKDTEDKDDDGIKDSRENHGELPDDFEGDHEDAEELAGVENDEGLGDGDEDNTGEFNDKDNDGISDSDENHGKLPDDFKGSHEDAEALDATGDAADDRDKDGTPDSEEDHGELPEKFAGDHEDAEKYAKSDKDDSTNPEDLDDVSEDPEGEIDPDDAGTPEVDSGTEVEVKGDDEPLDPETIEKLSGDLEKEIDPDAVEIASDDPEMKVTDEVLETK